MGRTPGLARSCFDPRPTDRREAWSGPPLVPEELASPLAEAEVLPDALLEAWAVLPPARRGQGSRRSRLGVWLAQAARRKGQPATLGLRPAEERSPARRRRRWV